MSSRSIDERDTRAVFMPACSKWRDCMLRRCGCVPMSEAVRMCLLPFVSSYFIRLYLFHWFKTDPREVNRDTEDPLNEK